MTEPEISVVLKKADYDALLAKAKLAEMTPEDKASVLFDWILDWIERCPREENFYSFQKFLRRRKPDFMKVLSGKLRPPE